MKQDIFVLHLKNEEDYEILYFSSLELAQKFAWNHFMQYWEQLTPAEIKDYWDSLILDNMIDELCIIERHTLIENMTISTNLLYVQP